MTPTILAKDGKLVPGGGSPGGRTIINTVLLTILNVVDFGMNVQDAVDAPRFHHQWLPDRIAYERSASLPTRARCSRRAGTRCVEIDDARASPRASCTTRRRTCSKAAPTGATRTAPPSDVRLRARANSRSPWIPRYSPTRRGGSSRRSGRCSPTCWPSWPGSMRRATRRRRCAGRSAQLDELFLLVVIGEFNAGKSAFVNALLGQRRAGGGRHAHHHAPGRAQLRARPSRAGVRREARTASRRRSSCCARSASWTRRAPTRCSASTRRSRATSCPAPTWCSS